MTQDSATPLRPPPLCASQQQPGNSAHNNADAAAAAAAETMEDDRALTACFTRKNSRNVKRIGLIGYGHLGQFLRAELSKYSAFYAIRKIWNRTEESKENVLPLTHLDLHHHLHHHHRHHNGHHLHHNGGAGDGGGANGDGGAGADTGGGGVAAGGEDEEEEEEDPLADVELVIEVAHPEVVKRYAPRILQHCDLFIGSVAALADAATLEAVESALRKNRHRRVFVPSAASFWGTEDIRAMARMGTLKSLTITIMKHPSALRVLGPLNDLSQRALKTNFPVVLYDGPVRLLCASAPSIANMIASAALAAKNLGFDGTRVKLIADPAISNWGIVEYEALGENGFRSTCRRESPAQPGAVSNEDNTYFSILSSIREAFYKPPGFNIC